MPWAFGVRSTMTDQPGLHSLYSTGSRGTATAFFITGRAGLVFFTVTRLEGERLVRREVLRRAVRPARVVLVALIAYALTEPLTLTARFLAWFRLVLPVHSPLLQNYFFRTTQTICAAARFAGRCAYYSASSSQALGRPTGSAGDSP